MNKRILAAFTAIAVAASTLTFMSFAADDSNTKDGVPVLSGTFAESEAYKSANNPPLDIANVFHLFAFEDITLNAHCNGNFAAPTVNALQASGTNQKGEQVGNTGTHPDVLGEISLATKSLQIQGSTKVDELLVPKSHVITDANGDFIDESNMSPKPVDENGKVVGQIKIGVDKANANLVDMKDSYVGFIDNSYVDFADYQKKYAEFSKNLAKLDSNVTLSGDENAQKATVNLAANKANVLNMTAEEFAKYQNGFEIKNVVFEDTNNDGKKEYPGTQSLIINVDMKGVKLAEGKKEKEYTTNSQTFVYRTDEKNNPVTNAEVNVLDGTIILWNIYDSSSKDYCYHGTYTFGKASLGSVLAPYAAIYANQNVDGNIIANTIETNAESHRCDFMGPLPVSFKKPTSSTTPTESETDSSSKTESQPESKPTESKPTESTPTESKPTESKPTESTPTESEPTESKPTESTPTESKPTESTPTESEPTESKPTESTPTESKPTESTPTESKPTESTPTESKPGDSVADEGDDNSKNDSSNVDSVADETDNNSKTDSVVDSVDNDNDNNSKTESNVSSENDEGVANGGDGNDRDTGIGNDGDENNRPSNSTPSSPKTGDSAPAALALALIGSALVITAAKKGKDK